LTFNISEFGRCKLKIVSLGGKKWGEYLCTLLGMGIYISSG
jgi:hypothetical protein